MSSYTNKYYKIPNMPHYQINKCGDILNQDGRPVRPTYINGHPCVQNNDKYVEIGRILLTMFIGDYPWEIIYKCANDVELDTIEYRIEVLITNDGVLINNELFKLVPGLADYAVSSNGTIYSLRSSRLMRIKYNLGYKTIDMYDCNGNLRTYKVHRIVAAAWLGFDINSRFIIHHRNGLRYDNRVENLEISTILENTRHAIDAQAKIVPFTLIEVRQILDLVTLGKSPLEIVNILDIPKSKIKQIRSLIYNFKLGRAYVYLRDKYPKIISSPIPNRQTLTPTTVENIKRDLCAGISGNAIAKRYGVSPSTIYKIRDNRTWKSIPAELIS